MQNLWALYVRTSAIQQLELPLIEILILKPRVWSCVLKERDLVWDLATVCHLEE